MTRIDFYVTRETEADAGLKVASRLAEKASGQGHRVFVCTENPSDAEQLDELLWVRKAAGFVPHALDHVDPTEQVVIATGADPVDHDDVLINLALRVPPYFSRFRRVAEVVTQAPESLECRRQTWRFYADRGYPMHKHEL